MKQKNVRTVVMVLALICAIGCGGEPTPEAAPPAPAPAATPAPQPQAPAPQPPPPQPAATATQPAASPPAALASAEGEQPGLRVEIQELKRTEGGTVTLKLAFVNTGGRTQFSVGNLDQVNLIDAVGKKKYFVAEDTAGRCLCSRNVTLDANARANVWAKFPAPPEDVQKITVVVPSFPPLEGIPITP
jgi:hypothetical protein